jgi:hypothetical protein
MSNKGPGKPIFSFERQPVATSTISDTAPYFRFADARKEFDTLQKTVQGGGKLSVVRHFAELLLFLLGAGVVEFHPSNGAARMIGIGFGAILIAEFFHWFTMRRRFQHWPCPRCNNEWPGNKKEKDHACKVCVLRLHQLSP